MADISITQTHQLTLKKAKVAAQKVADRMAEEFNVTSEWTGDVLSFNRRGVTGTLVVHHKEARLDITLGFLLKVFASTIEEKVTQSMKKVFSGNA